MMRRALAVLTLSAGLLPVLALPGQAAAPSGGCPPASTAPVLSIALSPAMITAGGSSKAFGRFTQNGCGISDGSPVRTYRVLSMRDGNHPRAADQTNGWLDRSHAVCVPGANDAAIGFSA